jgi:hypothetical protein
VLTPSSNIVKVLMPTIRFQMSGRAAICVSHLPTVPLHIRFRRPTRHDIALAWNLKHSTAFSQIVRAFEFPHRPFWDNILPPENHSRRQRRVHLPRRYVRLISRSLRSGEQPPSPKTSPLDFPKYSMWQAHTIHTRALPFCTAIQHRRCPCSPAPRRVSRPKLRALIDIPG